LGASNNTREAGNLGSLQNCNRCIEIENRDVDGDKGVWGGTYCMHVWGLDTTTTTGKMQYTKIKHTTAVNDDACGSERSNSMEGRANEA
jgi:hypothetical protein